MTQLLDRQHHPTKGAGGRRGRRLLWDAVPVEWRARARLAGTAGQDGRAREPE